MIEDEKTGLFFIDPTQVEMIPIDKLKLYKRNAKKHTPEQIEQIVNSIKAFGMNDPIGVWGEDNTIVEGHGRYLALRSLGERGEVPCIRLDHLTDEQRKAYALAHNQLTMNTGWDDELLLPELDELGDFFEMSDFGFFQDDGQEIIEEYSPESEKVGSLRERYLVPPFSVIYGNKPDWLARKRAWVDFGIRSELGRGGLAYNTRSNPEANFLPKSGGAERSKAFKNNTRLNSYMTKARRSATV